MSHKLSICIPTYNRISCLRPLLEQLCGLVRHSTDPDRIEVCVSDNGSNDGTWELLQEFMEQNDFLSARRNEENQGFGRNFWAVASMARGEYIYFTGDDDRFHDNAMEVLLSAVESDADLVLLNSHPVSGIGEDRFELGDVANIDSLDSYFSLVGAFHGSFIGNLMFKREVFERHNTIGDALHLSAYPHLFPVFRTLKDGKSLFVNRAITLPDDSVRGWSKMQPIYTAVDFARIVRFEVLPDLKTSHFRLLSQLVRSLPRAFFRQWNQKISPDPGNPYQSLRLKNLIDIYLTGYGI